MKRNMGGRIKKLGRSSLATDETDAVDKFLTYLRIFCVHCRSLTEPTHTVLIVHDEDDDGDLIRALVKLINFKSLPDLFRLPPNQQFNSVEFSKKLVLSSKYYGLCVGQETKEVPRDT